MRARIQRLFMRLERYIKTDLAYLTRGVFWIGLGQVIYVPFAFGLSVAFANLLPAAIYGTYRFIQSLASIVGVIAFTGIDTSVPQAVARGYEGMLRYGFRTYLKWGWVMFAASTLFAAYYIHYGNDVIAISLLIIGAFTPLFFGANLYTEFLAGRKNFRLATLLSSLQVVFTTLAMIGTLFLTHSVILLIFVYFAANAISSLTLYIYTLRRYKPNDRIDRESVHFGFHTSAANFISVVADQLDNILVFHFVGAAQLAVYSFASSLPEYLQSTAKMFNALAVPKFAVRESSSVRANIIGKTLWLMFALALVAIAYIVAAPYIYHFFYPAYLDAIQYSQVYAIVIAAGAINIPAAAINARRSVGGQYVTSFVDNIILIVLLVVLAFYYGIWGVIAARILGDYITLLIGVVWVYKFER